MPWSEETGGQRRSSRPLTCQARTVAWADEPASIKTFYQCLCELGKAKKVALVACMRKLLTTLNAMLKHRTPWRKAQPQQA